MNTHMEFFKNASGVNIGNMNNQSFDNSYVERITNGVPIPPLLTP